MNDKNLKYSQFDSKNVTGVDTNDKSNNNGDENMIEKTIETRYGTATLNESGYYEIENENGRKTNLHKLIYLANNGEIPKGYEIHHKNGVKTDNDPRNLVAMPKNLHKLVHDGYNNKKGVIKMKTNKKLCKTIENLQGKINVARKELKELRENNERYTDELADRELTVAEKEKIIREFEEMLEEKEKELLRYEAEKERLIRENKEHLARNRELRMVLFDVQEKLNKAKDELVFQGYELKHSMKELEKSRRECEEGREELKKSLEELEIVTEENKQLKKELEEDRKRMDSLDLMLDDIQDELDEIYDEEEDLRVETEELIDDIDNIENKTFGYSESGSKCLSDEFKAQIIEATKKSFDDRLISIKFRFDKLKGRQGELQALYNGICRRRQKLQNEGVLDF